jgi:hypothetical protein
MASIREGPKGKKNRARKFKQDSLDWLDRGDYQDSIIARIVEIKPDKQEHWTYRLLDPDTGSSVGWFSRRAIGQSIREGNRLGFRPNIWVSPGRLAEPSPRCKEVLPDSTHWNSLSCRITKWCSSQYIISPTITARTHHKTLGNSL